MRTNGGLRQILHGVSERMQQSRVTKRKLPYDGAGTSERVTMFLAHHITAPVYRSPGFLLDVARYASVRIKGRAT